MLILIANSWRRIAEIFFFFFDIVILQYILIMKYPRGCVFKQKREACLGLTKHGQFLHGGKMQFYGLHFAHVFRFLWSIFFSLHILEYIVMITLFRILSGGRHPSSAVLGRPEDHRLTRPETSSQQQRSQRLAHQRHALQTLQRQSPGMT